jgi:hypothetical protein
MNEDEEIARRHLVNLGFDFIEHEPDGNITPDFLVNGNIAIEVRRLNQNEINGSEFRGLEQTARQFHSNKMRKLLASLGPATTGRSWFVHFTFRRPLSEWSALKSDVRQLLKKFQEDPENRPRTQRVGGALTLVLLPASTPHAAFFIPGGYSDNDSGGWVFEETQKNLRFCIEEKTVKIAPFRHKYPEWWLIFVDRIGYGVEECDRELYRNHLEIFHTWDKVILLNPLDHRSAFEI